MGSRGPISGCNVAKMFDLYQSWKLVWKLVNHDGKKLKTNQNCLFSLTAITEKFDLSFLVSLA